jgi:hypothetical protein
MGTIFRNSYVPTGPIDEAPAVLTQTPHEWRNAEFTNAVYRTPDGGKTAVSEEWVKRNLRWYGGGHMRGPEPTLPYFAWDAPWVTRGFKRGTA